MALDSFRISLYPRICTSIVKHSSDSYYYSFISDIDKKITQELIS